MKIQAPIQITLLEANTIHLPVRPSILTEKERPRIPGEVPSSLRIPSDLKQDEECLRLCFICYVGKGVMHRSIPIHLSPPLNRGNYSISEEERRLQYQTMSSPNHSIWADSSGKANFFMIESVQHSHNLLAEAKSPIPLCDPNLMLDSMHNVDAGREKLRLIPQDLNPVTSILTYRRYIGMIIYQREVYDNLGLHIKRFEFATSQAALQLNLRLSSETFEHSRLFRSAYVDLSSTGPEKEVEKIVSIRQGVNDQVSTAL